MQQSETVVFGAPWARSLKLMTAMTVGLLVTVALIGWFTNPARGVLWDLNMIILPLVILAAGALFMIRAYTVSGDRLLVRRLGWNTEIDLNDLQSVAVDPQAMKKSWRVFGNGGLFCFAGKFRNRRLGYYRALATDPARAVVLHFRDRVMVVTPDAPDRFVARIEPGLSE